MSTHKHFDKICCVVLALTLLLTVLFINGEKLGIQKASTVPGYEKTIFDKSEVHTIDIVMDDWDEFTANCKSEEYYACTVVIDGEAYKNVAIRGKGNTSLSQVNNDRYSYKIEFDHYDSTNTYYGLDKLCLNNIIQDNTYIKDYLTYTMMDAMGVASPLCSYAYITVNGEDWGLYLAVEGVEESFLQRNYGKDYGELYKPDSMSMGGGRGNGDKFDMNEFMQGSDITDKNTQNKNDGSANEAEAKVPEESETDLTEQSTASDGDNVTAEQSSEGISTPGFSGKNSFGGEMPEGMTSPGFSGENSFGGEMPEGMTSPGFSGENSFGGEMSEGMTPPGFSGENSFGGEMSEGMTSPGFSGENSFGGEMPDMGNMPSMNFNLDEDTVREVFRKLGIDEALLDNVDFESITMTDIQNIASKIDEDLLSALMQELGNNFSFEAATQGGGFGGMGSSDVKLQYIDDNADSYSNIFENAKTDITTSDKARLIDALKKLSSGKELTDTVDIEAVIRYFVVHNFVVNGDSYTGSMIHNYYLYEKDGQLQMIPWDYNLAFGGFQSMGGATSTVNDPIDTPLSVTGSGDRPMIDWIFADEEYTELYHKYFNEFIEEYFDSGYFEEMIDSVKSMISPYVEKDPTKFCTYEEFETGISTLKDFCLLRAESIKGQLKGTIGSTYETQTEESLIDAGHLNISDMGSMGMGGGMGGNMDGNIGRFDDNMQKPQSSSGSSTDKASDTEIPSVNSDDTESNSGNSRPQMPGNFDFSEMSEIGSSESSSQISQNGMPQMPDEGFITDGAQSGFQAQNMFSEASVIMLAVSVLVLIAGIVLALKFKRRK